MQKPGYGCPPSFFFRVGTHRAPPCCPPWAPRSCQMGCVGHFHDLPFFKISSCPPLSAKNIKCLPRPSKHHPAKRKGISSLSRFTWRLISSSNTSFSSPEFHSPSVRL